MIAIEYGLEWCKSTQTDNEIFSIHHREIVFSFYEWCKFLEKHITSRPRPQFKIFFHDYLSQRLQKENGFNCWLKPLSNYIKNKENLLYVAKYSCLHHSCDNIFLCDAKRIRDDVVLSLKWSSDEYNQEHPIYIKKKRFIGEEREKLAGEIMSKGISHYQSESTLHNIFNEAENDIIVKRCNDPKILKQIKFETRFTR
jgi:hypothetical protein